MTSLPSSPSQRPPGTAVKGEPWEPGKLPQLLALGSFHSQPQRRTRMFNHKGSESNSLRRSLLKACLGSANGSCFPSSRLW